MSLKEHIPTLVTLMKGAVGAGHSVDDSLALIGALVPLIPVHDPAPAVAPQSLEAPAPAAVVPPLPRAGFVVGPQP